MQPDDPELRVRHEAGPDRAALKALGQPAGVRRVPLGPAGQVLDLLGVGQDTLEPLGLQPVITLAVMTSLTVALTGITASPSGSAP